jgi:hypothetical protein
MTETSTKPAWETWWGRILVRLTPPCTDVTRHISKSLDHPLPLWRRIQLRLHYRVCVWCLRYDQQLRLLNQAMGTAGDRLAALRQETLPADFREQLKARLAAGADTPRDRARIAPTWLWRFALAPVVAFFLSLGSQWCIRCVEIEGVRGALVRAAHAVLSWPYLAGRAFGIITETPQGFPLCCFIGWTVAGLIFVAAWAAVAKRREQAWIAS